MHRQKQSFLVNCSSDVIMPKIMLNWILNMLSNNLTLQFPPIDHALSMRCCCIKSIFFYIVIVIFLHNLPLILRCYNYLPKIMLRDENLMMPVQQCRWNATRKGVDPRPGDGRERIEGVASFSLLLFSSNSDEQYSQIGKSNEGRECCRWLLFCWSDDEGRRDGTFTMHGRLTWWSS